MAEVIPGTDRTRTGAKNEKEHVAPEEKPPRAAGGLRQGLTTSMRRMSPARRSATAEDTVSAGAGSRPKPWGKLLNGVLRHWWLLPSILGILFAVTAGLVGLTAQPSAQALLQVRTSAVDGQGMDRAVQTAMGELTTVQVFGRAAQLTGVSAEDLESRTQVAAVPNSQLVSVTVVGPTREQAIREADAVAAAGIATGAARVRSELGVTTQQARDLIARSTVPNPGAEQARVARLGAALADNQGDVISGTGQLALLQSAQGARTTPSAPLLAGMGLLAGSLLGLAATIVLWTQRGKVSSTDELRRSLPDIAVVELDELGATMALDNPQATTVVLAGVRQSVAELQTVTGDVMDVLTTSGFNVTVADVASLRRRMAEKQVPKALSLLPVTLNHSVVREVRANPALVLLVVIKPRRTRLEWLDPFVPLGRQSYLLVAGRPPSPG